MPTFEQYMAQSGRQSEMDIIRGQPGGYEKAKAAFEQRGSYGAPSASGMSGIDLGQVPSALKYAQELGVGEEKAMSDIVMKMRAWEKPLDVYGRLETEAGIPELRVTSTTLAKEIANVEDYLSQIEPDIGARTRESLVTEAQRRGMVAAGRKPYLEKLTKLATGLGRVRGSLSEAMAGVGTKVGLAMRGQEMELEPLKMQYTSLVDRNARMMTGFTADRQTQLDVLFDKLQRERQLADQEWELASQLSREETEYSRTLKTAAANAGLKLSGGESNDDILQLIGGAAAEEIQWQRREKKTVGEKSKTTALMSLRREAEAGASYEDIVRRYSAADIPLYQIREEYQNARKMTLGTTAKQEQQWQLPLVTPYEQLKFEEGEGGKMKYTLPDGTVIEF